MRRSVRARTRFLWSGAVVQLALFLNTFQGDRGKPLFLLCTIRSIIEICAQRGRMPVENTLDAATKIALIHKQACFKPLNSDEINMLADLFSVKNFPAGSVIVKQGDIVDSIYLIAEGEADVIVSQLVDGKREDKNVATLKETQAIGLSETGFYSLSGLRTATVTAKTDMTLLYLRVAVFHGFALAHAHVAEVMRQFSGSRMQKESVK